MLSTRRGTQRGGKRVCGGPRGRGDGAEEAKESGWAVPLGAGQMAPELCPINVVYAKSMPSAACGGYLLSVVGTTDQTATNTDKAAPSSNSPCKLPSFVNFKNLSKNLGLELGRWSSQKTAVT